MSPIVKRKGEKFTLPSKYLLFILTILCAVMMLLTFNTDFLSAPLNAISSVLIVPFQNGVSAAGGELTSRTKQLAQVRELLIENAKLQEQVDALTIENTTLQQNRFELNNLRELYSLDAQYEDYEKTGARIISKDSGNWFDTFVINKGSDDGIEVDMNVLAGSGLVGRVTEVGPSWAKVVSIVSDQSSLSGMVLSTSDNLIVEGNLISYGDGYINFSMLQDDQETVVVGDKIVTSNISDKYLPGILVGYISSINTDANNLTKSGTLTPAVDFSHLQEVLVIMTKKQTVNDVY
ncbi:MAG: rod shape-determining protein MreC [Lachnospiraceae bacterium]|nr:rod shape-determining protein MreC [Lachnospiraceae bacterium]